jgi:aspartyl-tRNA(Asn)/glutamyl-tRNA(Gln) amidotransferase subunit C
MDIEQVKKLAHLARLDVPETELAHVASEMGAILGFVDEIQKVQIDSTQSTARELNVFRDDIVAPINPAHDLVEAAALHQDHFVKVPKVIGD